MKRSRISKRGWALASVLTLSVGGPTASRAELVQTDTGFNSAELELVGRDCKIDVLEDSGADEDDRKRVTAALLQMANGGTLAFEQPDGTETFEETLGSAKFEQMLAQACQNEFCRFEFRVVRNHPTAFATTFSSTDPSLPSFIIIDIGDIEAVENDPARFLDGELSPRGLQEFAQMFLFETLAHELRHAGTGNRKTGDEDDDGDPVVERDPDTDARPLGSPYPDPILSSETHVFPDAPSGLTDRGPAVNAANDVIEQMNGRRVSEYRRLNYSYLLDNPQDPGNPTAAKLSADYVIGIFDDNGFETTVVRFDLDRAAREIQGVANPTQEALESAARKTKRLQRINEMIRQQQEDEQDDDGDTDDGPVTPDGETDTEGDDSGETDTDGEDTDGGDTEDGTTGGETDGDRFARCTPGTAPFSGDFVPQAGVEVDFVAQTCSTVSGLPPGDLLVIDDFSGSFGGSGSGASVVSLSVGSFFNDVGFFVIDGLPTDEAIQIELLTDDQQTVILEFTIIAGGPQAALQDVAMLL